MKFAVFHKQGFYGLTSLFMILKWSSQIENRNLLKIMTPIIQLGKMILEWLES